MEILNKRELQQMPLIEKLQKYQPYHQAKLINMNILQVKKYYLLFKSQWYSEIINKLEKIEEGGKKADRSKMVCKRYNKAYNSGKVKIIRSFGNDIRTNFINMDPENAEQDHLAKYIKEFKSNAKPQADERKWCLKHLKTGYFQILNNQNNQKNQSNQAAMIN